MKKFLYLCLGSMLANLAMAQESVPVGDALDGLLKIMAQQCQRAEVRLESEKESMDLTMRLAIEDARSTLCVCVPDRIRGLQKSLSAVELARTVSSQEELLAVVRPKALDPCSAKQLLRAYEFRCEDRFKPMMPADMDATAFCGCMKTAVAAIPEKQATEMGLAAADYIPRAAEAKKKGEPLPPRPAVLDPVIEAQQKCGKGRLPNAFGG